MNTVTLSAAVCSEVLSDSRRVSNTESAMGYATFEIPRETNLPAIITRALGMTAFSTLFE